MTEFTPARLAELRAVAEAATEGPWRYNPKILGLPNTTVMAGDSQLGYVGVGTFLEPNATHIAAFDPPTVLALIAALEAKTAEVESLAKEALDDLPRKRLGSLLSRLLEVERERVEARAEVSKIEGRALEAEAAIERVREAAIEVANQERSRGRTHYENCWKHHLHCLAAKIIYETEADDE